jgi:Zn-finger nucleic acid-binding protein
MKCPACGEPLAVLELDDVEVDYCFACKGVWLDAGELELLFGDARPRDDFLTGGPSEAGVDETARRCPICSKKMLKEATRGVSSVTYDRCALGDGLWFDQGELEQVLATGSMREGGEVVVAHLRGLFAGSSGVENNCKE